MSSLEIVRYVDNRSYVCTDRNMYEDYVFVMLLVSDQVFVIAAMTI